MDNDPALEPLLTAPEVAKILRVHRKTVWELVDAKVLVPVTFKKPCRRGWRFTREAVAACIKQCQSDHAATRTSSTSRSVASELDAMLGPSPKRARLKLVSEPN